VRTRSHRIAKKQKAFFYNFNNLFAQLHNKIALVCCFLAQLVV
jgi:hypothetical protein